VTDFTEHSDRQLLVEIAQRVARIEQSAEDRKDQGSRITSLEHWRTRAFAFAAAWPLVTNHASNVAAPLMALFMSTPGVH
jgi:hypothetical protein